MDEIERTIEVKAKSAYLKALKEVKDLIEEGYTKEMLLEWLNEKIENEMEEICEILE